MMITVVGQDDSVTKRATCRNCGAIIEYTPNDLQEQQTRDISSCADTEFYLKCPQCGNHVYTRK